MNTGMYVSFSISMPVVLEVVVGPSADVGIVDGQVVDEEQLDVKVQGDAEVQEVVGEVLRLKMK